jgi:ABC-type transport system substrate-binding protein
MVFRLNRKIVNFDPYYGMYLTRIHIAWMEKLHTPDWTLDSAAARTRVVVGPTKGKGHSAETWKFTDPSTYVVHLRKEVHWQDLPPANGREVPI